MTAPEQPHNIPISKWRGYPAELSDVYNRTARQDTNGLLLMSVPKDMILCVDDETTVVRACCIAVAVAGFRSLVAENGAAGLEVFIAFKDEICLVLSDIIMPAVNGIDMAESIVQVDPNAKILLMSGYTDQVLERQGRQRFPFIRKPFIHAVLIEKIRSVLGISDEAAAQS